MRDANRYVAIESAIALGVSLLINIMVTAVFAHGLYNQTNANIVRIGYEESITNVLNFFHFRAANVR